MSMSPKRVVAVALAVVAVCVLQISGAGAQYVPGSCLANERQLDVSACMSGDNFCEWCDFDSFDSTPAETATAMSVARAEEKKLYIANMVGSELSRPTDERRTAEVIGAEFDLAVADVPAFNTAFPQRCARKWTPESCPKKIVFSITSCERAYRGLQLAEAREEERKRTRTYRGSSDYDVRRPDDQAAAELLAQFRSAASALCDARAGEENCHGCRRSLPEIEDLLSREADDDQYTVLNTNTAVQQRAGKAPKTAATVDSERRAAFTAKYISAIVPPITVKVSEEARETPAHSCHQHLDNANCYLAGCSFCEHRQRSSGHSTWPDCQPAWSHTACPNRVPDLELADTRRVMRNPTEEMWKNFAEKGFFTRPEATAEQMDHWKGDVRHAMNSARRAKEANAEDTCMTHGTLVACLGASCQWCRFPLDTDLTRCRHRWNTDVAAACYTPPLTSLASLAQPMKDAYSNALNEKLAISAAYEERSAARAARAREREREEASSLPGLGLLRSRLTASTPSREAVVGHSHTRTLGHSTYARTRTGAPTHTRTVTHRVTDAPTHTRTVTHRVTDAPTHTRTVTHRVTDAPTHTRTATHRVTATPSSYGIAASLARLRRERDVRAQLE